LQPSEFYPKQLPTKTTPPARLEYPKLWTFNELGEDDTASSVTIYQYVNDDRGNWIERNESHILRKDSYQSKTTSTRKVTYLT